ncbi:LuxR family transcriptional regulator [Rhizobium etli]|uniref:LuxR family transcriptional regulator n=1 Tax=Rhizobium etli TaxID=29449 RepID=UPI001FD98DF0|nr:LuxR family transcriptional regulator [Rhizobium sp. IE4771]
MFTIEFGRFLDQADSAAQPDQLFDLLAAFALNFDIPWVAYGPLAADRWAFKRVKYDPQVVLNYPDEWQKRCSEMAYDRVGPVVKESRKQRRAFQWSEVYNDVYTTEGERRIFDEAAAFGLRSGITVPLHGPDGSFAITSFAQHSSGQFQNRAISYLQLAALHFHSRVGKFADSNCIDEGAVLSGRERECIAWVARGKSSSDIGTILGISKNTVDFHIKNVMRKLDTASRTVAAITAATLGIIEL